jgi:hypothetical protein
MLTRIYWSCAETAPAVSASTAAAAVQSQAFMGVLLCSLLEESGNREGERGRRRPRDVT